MNEKNLLQTTGRMREKAPVNAKSGGFISLHQLEGGKLNLSDMDYCVRFGTPAHFAGLRKLIEADRAKLPGYTYWRCERPNCQWRAKMNGDKKEPVACLKCNMARHADGSWMKRMTAKEAEQFERAEAERGRAEVEQLQNIAFNANCENRKQLGLPLLSREEFLAKREVRP